MGGVTPRWAVRPAPGALRPRLLRGRLSGPRLAGQRLPDAVHARKPRLGHRVPESQPDGRIHQQRVLTRVSARRGPGAAPRRRRARPATSGPEPCRGPDDALWIRAAADDVERVDRGQLVGGQLEVEGADVL